MIPLNRREPRKCDRPCIEVARLGDRSPRNVQPAPASSWCSARPPVGPPRSPLRTVSLLSLSSIKSGHIGGVAHREFGGKEYARLVRRRWRSEHLSPTTNASVSRCDNSCTTAGRDGGVARRTQQRGQGIPCGSNRSAFQHIHFAKGARGEVGRSRMPIDRSLRIKTSP